MKQLLTMKEITRNVIEAYNHIANEYKNTYYENDEYDKKYFRTFFNNLSGNTILDIGCGVGVNTSYFIENGFDSIGIDVCDSMLNIAKRLYPTIKFDKQDALDTQFSANSFDGVVLSYVMNHFNKDGLNLLKFEIDRILKDNGIVFISAHIGTSESVVSDPLDNSINIYYNFLSLELLDSLFSNYVRLDYQTRKSFGEEEFLCDKMFVIYKKEK